MPRGKVHARVAAGLIRGTPGGGAAREELLGRLDAEPGAVVGWRLSDAKPTADGGSFKVTFTLPTGGERERDEDEEDELLAAGCRMVGKLRGPRDPVDVVEAGETLTDLMNHAFAAAAMERRAEELAGRLDEEVGLAQFAAEVGPARGAVVELDRREETYLAMVDAYKAEKARALEAEEVRALSAEEDRVLGIVDHAQEVYVQTGRPPLSDGEAAALREWHRRTPEEGLAEYLRMAAEDAQHDHLLRRPHSEWDQLERDLAAAELGFAAASEAKPREPAPEPEHDFVTDETDRAFARAVDARAHAYATQAGPSFLSDFDTDEVFEARVYRTADAPKQKMPTDAEKDARMNARADQIRAEMTADAEKHAKGSALNLLEGKKEFTDEEVARLRALLARARSAPPAGLVEFTRAAGEAVQAAAKAEHARVRLLAGKLMAAHLPGTTAEIAEIAGMEAWVAKMVESADYWETTLIARAPGLAGVDARTMEAAVREYVTF